MAEIKDASRIAAKWARVAPQRSQDYAEGVQNPRRDWARAAAAAETTHAAAMQQAAQRKSYSRGVNAAGSARWQERSARKGPGRFAEGVAMAEGDYAHGFEPFAAVIKATTLPPRFPKGDPRNLDRVRAISTALAAKRQGSTT